MKINEIVENIMQQMVVAKDDARQTTLHDPKTKVTLSVPKQAGKQGMIKADPKGNFVFDPEDDGESEQTLKPGTKVQVQKKM
jgi:VCBS repeat-containing protein